MKLVYSIKPLRPIESIEQSMEWRAEHRSFNFWKFLDTPFLGQIEDLFLLFLKRRKVVKQRSIEERSVHYEVFETDSIYDEIVAHCVAYMNAFGECPSAIVMGRSTHHRLTWDSQMQYQMRYEYNTNQGLHIRGIVVTLVPHLEGFFLMPHSGGQK